MEISSHSEKLVSLEVLRITKLSAKSSLKETLIMALPFSESSWVDKIASSNGSPYEVLMLKV